MAVTMVGNTANQYRDYRNYTNLNEREKDLVKGASLALSQDPLRGTGYKMITSSNAAKQTSTVLNIIDTTKSSRGVSVFRVDGTHTNANYYHFNTNSNIYKNNKIYTSLNHKPISNTTYSVAKNAGTISKVAKVGGRAVAVAAVISDGKDIYDAYKEDGNKIGKNTVTTTSGVAGSWIGGVGGSKGGAMGGAAIGSMICPGLGTVIGAAVGGIIGGIGGGLVGRYAGQEISGAIYDKSKKN